MSTSTHTIPLIPPGVSDTKKGNHQSKRLTEFRGWKSSHFSKLPWQIALCYHNRRCLSWPKSRLLDTRNPVFNASARLKSVRRQLTQDGSLLLKIKSAKPFQALLHRSPPLSELI